MKICILSFYQGLTNRGVERFIEEFQRHLGKENQIRIYQAEKKTLLKTTDQGFLRRLYLDFNNRQVALFTLKILKQIWQEKPDILMPTNNGWQSIFCKFYCLLTRTKLILAGHSGLGQDDKLNLWLFPDRFVVFSETQKEWARKMNPLVRIVKIPHGVDLKQFNNQVRPLKIDLEKPVILCVAGEEKFKRVVLTIKAISQLKKGSLLLVGRQAEQTLKMAKKMLGKKFKHLKVDFGEMPSVYRAADLFTSVSDSREAFGISYLEAMACNLAVVATDDALRREIIGQAGFLVKKPEDAKVYAQTLKRALEKDWRDEPMKQAKNFSWQKTASYYQKLFDSFK